MPRVDSVLGSVASQAHLATSNWFALVQQLRRRGGGAGATRGGPRPTPAGGSSGGDGGGGCGGHCPGLALAATTVEPAPSRLRG